MPSTITSDESTSTESVSTGSRWSTWKGWSEPPGWAMVAVTLVLAVVIIHETSLIGRSFRLAMVCVAAVIVVALTWIVRLVTYLSARRRGRSSGNPRWFVPVPAILITVLVLVASMVPLKVRFGMAEDEFAALVDHAPAPTVGYEAQVFEVPERVGPFEISKAYRRGDAVIFEVPGGFFSTIGFAYLPSGPSDELAVDALAAVEFTHLEGDWYTFTSEHENAD